MYRKDLEEILAHLDMPIPFSEKFKGYLRECKKNAGFEAACIAICEAGEFGAEVSAYLLSLPHMNELGLVGGTALGGAYAVYHTLRHGKQHNRNASLYDAALYAGSTESACVISATGVEYLAGKLASIPNNPFSKPNIEMRVGALPLAFILGLAAMSALTYRKEDECDSFVSEKNALPDTMYHLTLNMPKQYGVQLERDRLTITGKQSTLEIREHPLPRSPNFFHDKKKHSLYIARASVCRYRPETKQSLRMIVRSIFTEAGLDVRHFKNIFEHGHE